MAKKIHTWKITTFAFAALFLLSVLNVISFPAPGDNAVGNSVVDYLVSASQGQLSPTLKETSRETLYKTVLVDPQLGGEVTMYVTPDKNVLYVQGALLNGSSVPPADAVEVDIEVTSEDHVLGDSDAEVTIVEYSDFQCPYCSRLYSDALQDIKSEYVETGKAKFVYRHFPLSGHPEAQPAAEASECAAEQGKFWDYHDLLFENQQALGEESYKQWAIDLGLDSQQFDDCYDSGKYTAKVQDDFNSGASVGVSGTPATFVNGKMVSGAVPFSAFQAAIDAELA